MEQNIETLYREVEKELEQITQAHEVEELRVRYLGRKGPIQELMKLLRTLPPEKRPDAGQQINNLKNTIEQKLQEAFKALSGKEQEERLEKEVLDVTLPGRRRSLGRAHPIAQTMRDVLSILEKMGFTVQQGPDVETDYYNFEALNFAKDHPARDMQDTFFIKDSVLLRTHTSNTQVRVMEATTPPIRVVAPGKCYRNESITARSHVFFHQVEALYIDEEVSLGDLIGTLHEFVDKLVGKSVSRRIRQSYFPFVEPGVELDISCLQCQGHGCAMCKHTGWLEVAGAGMVHPNVLRSGGIDPEKYSGYAWGLGIERLTLVKHGIRDIRLFSENDLRFLEQFN